MPLTHHTANAYRRHAPQNWAPKSASWAVQNYAAAVRVVPQPADRCRLEYRLPGSDINPFLALAFVLGAGLWGLESERRAPAGTDRWGTGSYGCLPEGAALPHDLFEAIDRLARSERAQRDLGRDLRAASSSKRAARRRPRCAARPVRPSAPDISKSFRVRNNNE